jgi:glycosyltransferase involved in cell wall biosynthesis
MPYQVIPNFVPDEVEADRVDIESYAAQLPDGDFILFVGDLSRDKGIHILLSAYGDLKNAPPLVLIGRRCQDTPTEFPPNVLFLNSWPHAAVMAAWRRCTIAVAPSTWPEPFGVVVLEAMAAGRPVIASRIGGLPDMVVDGETGMLIPPDDPDALRTALERLLADRELCERLGQAGQRRVGLFRADAVIPRIEPVYRMLMTKETSTELQQAIS